MMKRQDEFCFLLGLLLVYIDWAITVEFDEAIQVMVPTNPNSFLRNKFDNPEGPVQASIKVWAQIFESRFAWKNLFCGNRRCQGSHALPKSHCRNLVAGKWA